MERERERERDLEIEIKNTDIYLTYISFGCLYIVFLGGLRVPVLNRRTHTHERENTFQRVSQNILGREKKKNIYIFFGNFTLLIVVLLFNLLG